MKSYLQSTKKIIIITVSIGIIGFLIYTGAFFIQEKSLQRNIKCFELVSNKVKQDLNGRTRYDDPIVKSVFYSSKLKTCVYIVKKYPEYFYAYDLFNSNGALESPKNNEDVIVFMQRMKDKYKIIYSMSETPYLLISPEQFHTTISKWRYGGCEEGFMRYVESYLERNDIPYNYRGSDIYIPMKDRYQPKEICEHLKLPEIQYFENGKRSTLFVPNKKFIARDASSFFSKAKIGITLEDIGKLQKEKLKQEKEDNYLPFVGKYVDKKPKLGLFGRIEKAIQGSFLR